MLGELTWLLTQSATHKHFTFADLEWMILPPLMLEQYRVFRQTSAPSGDTMGKGATFVRKSMESVGFLSVYGLGFCCDRE